MATPHQRAAADLLAMLITLQLGGCRDETPAPEQAPALVPPTSTAPPTSTLTPTASVSPAVTPLPADVPPPAAVVPPPTDIITPPPATGGPEEADGSAIDLTPLRSALAGGDPEVIEVVERHPLGRDQLVLYRWYGARAWRAQQRAAGRLDEALEELNAKIDACEDEEVGKASVCLEAAITDPYLAWSAAGPEVFAWEVARVRDGSTVIARMRLFDLSAPISDTEAEIKFKVYDIDGDQRSELTVIVPVELPDHDEGMEEQTGELGFILEAADLHVQFSATRRHDARFEDDGGSESHAQTVWLARDVNGDHHPDLQIRETTRQRDIAGDGEEDTPAARSTSRKTVCLYEPAPDLWRCPEQLGQQLLPGTSRG